MYHMHKTGMKKHIVPPPPPFKSLGGQEIDVENKVLMSAPLNIGIEELKTKPFR